MDKRLRVVTNHYFQKNKENAFTNPALQKFLDSQSVGELYITGLKAEACVWSTAQGALKRQYKVNVLTDCIATTSQKKKERAIKKYRQLGIGVLTSEKIALK